MSELCNGWNFHYSWKCIFKDSIFYTFPHPTTRTKKIHFFNYRQDEVKGIRFSFLPEISNKRNNNIWTLKTNEVSPTVTPNLFLGECLCCKAGRRNQGRAWWLRRQRWEPREGKVARVCRREHGTGESFTERKCWRSAEGLPLVFGWILVSTGIWGNCLKLEKTTQKERGQDQNRSCFFQPERKSLN